MVKGKGKKARLTRNLLLKMNEGFDGPLNALHQWKVQRKRVKVKSTIFQYKTVTFETLDLDFFLINLFAFSCCLRYLCGT